MARKKTLNPVNYVQMAKDMVAALMPEGTEITPELVSRIFLDERFMNAWAGYFVGKGYTHQQHIDFERECVEDTVDWIRENWDVKKKKSTSK